jgi:hypothetical protein
MIRGHLRDYVSWLPGANEPPTDLHYFHQATPPQLPTARVILPAARGISHHVIGRIINCVFILSVHPFQLPIDFNMVAS